MLVLSRRVGESVCVGPGVTIRVIETKGSRVRLAIDAPTDVRIARGEAIAPVEPAKKTWPDRSRLLHASLVTKSDDGVSLRA